MRQQVWGACISNKVPGAAAAGVGAPLEPHQLSDVKTVIWVWGVFPGRSGRLTPGGGKPLRNHLRAWVIPGPRRPRTRSMSGCTRSGHSAWAPQGSGLRDPGHCPGCHVLGEALRRVRCGHGDRDGAPPQQGLEESAWVSVTGHTKPEPASGTSAPLCKPPRPPPQVSQGGSDTWERWLGLGAATRGGRLYLLQPRPPQLALLTLGGSPRGGAAARAPHPLAVPV